MTLDLGVPDSLHFCWSTYSMSSTEETVMNKTLTLLSRSFYSGEKHVLSLYCVPCSNHPASITTLLIPHNYLGWRYQKLSLFLWVKPVSYMEGLNKVPETGGGGSGIWTELDWLRRTPPQPLNHIVCRWLLVSSATAAPEVWWGRYQTVGSWALNQS